MILNHYNSGPPKRDLKTGGRKFYKQFKKEHKDIKITSTEFIQIIRAINTEYSKEIISGVIVDLPFSIAQVSINKYKKKLKEYPGYTTLPSFRAIDWGASDKANALLPEGSKKVVIYHFNDHTEGYVCKWWYYMGKMVLEREIWSCTPTRKNQQLLSESIKNDPELYQKYKSRGYHGDIY